MSCVGKRSGSEEVHVISLSFWGTSLEVGSRPNSQKSSPVNCESLNFWLNTRHCQSQELTHPLMVAAPQEIGVQFKKSTGFWSYEISRFVDEQIFLKTILFWNLSFFGEGLDWFLPTKPLGNLLSPICSTPCPLLGCCKPWCIWPRRPNHDRWWAVYIAASEKEVRG